MAEDLLPFIVPVLTALAGGAAIPELIRVWKEARSARLQEMTLEQRLERSQRRERIAIEWGHKNAVKAIRAGVPEEELPVLDFKDDK